MPIIVCSGYSENLDAAVLQEMGVDHYLMKPVGNWEMAAAIRSLLDR
jgi:DNA-binding response OmpR family regulator